MIKVERECPKCGKVQTVKIDDQSWTNILRGEYIQMACPNLTSNDREVLLSGICPDCWDAIFNDN